MRPSLLLGWGCRGLPPDPAAEPQRGLCICWLLLFATHCLQCISGALSSQGYRFSRLSQPTHVPTLRFVSWAGWGFPKPLLGGRKRKYPPAHCRLGQGSWNKSAGCFFPQVLCRESPCTTHGKSSLVVGVHGVLFPMHPCHVANGQTPLRGVRQWGGF